tara:strand:- start:623 stop:898 length:276 start_codon:yes stop_codon:yes gene_type:complete
MKKLSAEQINGIRDWIFKELDIEGTTENALKSFEENFPLAGKKDLDSYWLSQANDKLNDINQWSGLALSRSDLSQRVTRSLLGDIINRTTD